VAPVQGEATPGAPTRPRLNESQRRALAITLRLLEERLAEIRAVIDHGEEGVLYRRPRPPFDREQAARIEHLQADLGDAIRRAAAAFDLPRDEQNPASRIVALLGMSWQSLGEMDARGMRAYGETDPRLGEELDPLVQRLLDLVSELQAAATASA
jgi:hypothetical protein